MEVQTLSVPVVRYVNMTPGVVTFQVNNKQASGKEHFNLITEFKKVQENIVWKDYMDYYPMTQEHFDVRFFKSESGEHQLLVKSSLPKFKNQLFSERANLKYVSVLYNIYLIPDQNFPKRFKQCGYGAIDEDIAIFKSTANRVFKNDMENKVVEVIFDQQHLNQVDFSDHLSVFAYLKLTFVEDEYDEFDMTLDQRFTDVPFFLIVLRNEYATFFGLFLKKFDSSASMWLLGVFLVAGFYVLYRVYRQYKKKRQGYSNVIDNAKDAYNKDEEHNSLEMT